MELHTCHNCEVIEEIVSTRLHKFEVLAEENLSLHRVLLRTKESQKSLEAEVVNLNNVIVMERQRNLDLYLKQINEQKHSNMLMNVELKANVKNKNEHIRYTKRVPFQSSKKHLDYKLLSDKYESLMSLYEEQTKIYEENLNTLWDVNKKYVKKLETNLQNVLDHSLTILDMYSFYKIQFFEQKLENSRVRKDFLENTEVVTNINKKRIEEVKQQLLEETTRTVKDQTKGVLNSLHQQINQRDKLVHMLRKHQTDFDKEVRKLQNQLEMERQHAEIYKNYLVELLQNEKKKRLALEQRRKFDFQGFQTDIQHFKKKLTRGGYDAKIAGLNQEIDAIGEDLRKSYLK